MSNSLVVRNSTLKVYKWDDRIQTQPSTYIIQYHIHKENPNSGSSRASTSIISALERDFSNSKLSSQP
jgi:hypothetical protein